jgi:hypothetical protein
MPDAKNNAKLTGDTHLPDVESDQPMEEGSDGALGADGTPSDRGRATESGIEQRPGRGINQAGFLKDPDEPDEPQGSRTESGDKPR